MNKKITFLWVAVLFVVLVAGVFLINKKTGNSVKENQINNLNLELEKYRSKEIPEECRLPDYENDLEAWKQHLSHHQNTWYCLEDYYNENIENYLKGGSE